MPSTLRALWSKIPTNPLQPTSIGKHLAFQPCSRQLMTRCSYLVCFLSWASPKWSSHCTISSMMMMFFIAFETRHNSALRVVLTMCWRNLSCFSWSTKSCQSSASDKILADALLDPGFGFAPAFTKMITLAVLRTRLQILIPLLMVSGFSIWLWRQVYRPSQQELLGRSSVCAPWFLLSTGGSLRLPLYPR